MNTLEDRAEQGTSQAQNQGAYRHLQERVRAATTPSTLATGRDDATPAPSPLANARAVTDNGLLLPLLSAATPRNRGAVSRSHRSMATCSS